MEINANWLIGPIVIPLIGAALGLLVAPGNRPFEVPVQRVLALTALLANLLVALAIFNSTILHDQRMVLQVGLWQAPFGITLFADGLSAIMLTLTAIVAGPARRHELSSAAALFGAGGEWGFSGW